MGTVFLTAGVLLMALAGVGFAVGQLYLRGKRRELEEYFQSIYGEGGSDL